jgi:hypothetical protein
VKELAEVEAARTPLFANTKTAACEKPAEPATIPYEQLRRGVGMDR